MAKQLAPRLEKFVQRHNIKHIQRDGKEYLVLYKAVREDYGSWFKRASSAGAYKPGNLVVCRDVSNNRNNDCGRGLHAATLDFAAKFATCDVPFVVEVLVKPQDIVCVPHGNMWGPTKKIRCKRLLVNRLIARLCADENAWQRWTGCSWSRHHTEFNNLSSLLGAVR
jgi:hypothetical protein